MKRLLKKFVVGIFAGSLVLSVSAAPETDIADVKPLVDQTMQQFMRVNRVPGAVVELYVHGKPYSFQYGVANLDTRVPVTDNTVFELGSVTKLFTALLVAMQVNAGKMNLQDSITQYIPELRNAYGPINQVTLENLATHTSGLPFYTPGSVKTEEGVINYLRRWHPYGPVGSSWAYSNFGIGLLGSALEYNTHENYNQLYRSRILTPLKMNPIGIAVPNYLDGLIAQGYDGAGIMEPYTALDLLPASWAIKATGHDMMRFLAASIGLPGTPPEIADAMRLTQTPFYLNSNMMQGLGWQIYRITDQDRVSLMHTPSFMSIGPIKTTAISER